MVSKDTRQKLSGGSPEPCDSSATCKGSRFKSAKTKTDALFLHRLVIPLAQAELAPDEFSAWYEHATEVQKAIYDIDFYYEHSARVAAEIEAPLWHSVASHIGGGLKCGADILERTLEDLRRYALTEQRIHVFDLIDTREFEVILGLKCSDVRIARTLILTYGHRPLMADELRFWDLYDQCWELIEDMQDLEEDGMDWNFNFWLYPYMRGSSAIIGLDNVAELLRRQLSRLQDAYRRLPTGRAYLFGGLPQKTFLAGEKVLSQRDHVLTAIKAGRVSPFRHLLEGADPIENSEAAIALTNLVVNPQGRRQVVTELRPSRPLR